MERIGFEVRRGFVVFRQNATYLWTCVEANEVEVCFVRSVCSVFRKYGWNGTEVHLCFRVQVPCKCCLMWVRVQNEGVWYVDLNFLTFENSSQQNLWFNGFMLARLMATAAISGVTSHLFHTHMISKLPFRSLFSSLRKKNRGVSRGVQKVSRKRVSKEC